MATRTATTRSKPQDRKNSQQAAPDALALLKADHRAVDDLFAEFESARKPERKEAIAKKICQELTLHAELEESSFYPFVREELTDDGDLMSEAEVEHASLKWLIAQIEGDVATEMFEARVMVLKEYVQHHVKEEEKEMFPKIRESDLDTKELGQVLQARKQELQAQKPTH